MSAFKRYKLSSILEHYKSTPKSSPEFVNAKSDVFYQLSDKIVNDFIEVSSWHKSMGNFSGDYFTRHSIDVIVAREADFWDEVHKEAFKLSKFFEKRHLRFEKGIKYG